MKPTSRGKKNNEARAIYDKVIEIFFYFRDINELDEIVHPKFVGYGTAGHEYFRNREELRNMAKMQAEQLRGTEYTLTRKPVIEKFLANDSTFLILEDFELHMQDNDHILQLRLSTILEKESGKWLITHFHGSTPDKDIAEEEALPMEGLRKKNADLEAKIEERTRDLEIEAALERVRSKSMGMQKSEELKDVVKIIFNQLAHLKINAEHAGIVVDYEPKKDWHFWIAETQDIPAKVTVPYLDLVWDRQFTEAKKKGKDFFTTQMDFAEKNSFYKVLLPHIEGLTKKVKDFYYNCPGLAISTVIEKDIGLYIENFSGTPYSSEENDILRRFAKVFQQTYTRFLDLKKSEAQAREAQIQLALERVRARSLAMKSSDELHEVLAVLFRQFDDLGIRPVNVFLSLFDKEKRTLTYRASGKSGKRIPGKQVIEVDSMEALRALYDKWLKDNSDNVEVIYYPKEVLPQLFGIFSETFSTMPKADRMGPEDFPEGGYSIAGYTPFGYLGYDHQRKATEEEQKILARFCMEFTMVYQRFLDLQKSEAQAREAETELATERIRSQAMAMNKSSELLDIVVTMRNEFIRLGHEAHYFWHMMWLPDKYEKAMTSGDGKRIGMVMELPRHIHGDIKLLANWEKSKEPIVVYPMDVEAAIDYVDKMIKLGDFKQVDPNAPSHDDIRQIGGLTFIMARTTHGEIGYSLPGVVKQPPEEDLIILQRFAGAFDLAHRRFLDLEKSEAQAREVEIELALERVRARTMAMQHSDELQEASYLLDEQVRKLGIQTWGCAFNIYREKDSIEWFGNEKGILPTYTVPRKGIFKKYYDLGQKGSQLHIQEFKGAKCIAHYEYMSTLPVIGDVLKQLKKTNGSYPEYQIDHVVYFKYGYLLFITIEPVPDSHDIFKRFAQVFEQTYTRFLDLQKAEAQTREAQIEAALEKVRSQSLAMHTTSEMQLVANAVYDQLHDLGVVMDAVGMSGVIEEKKDYDVWIGGAPMGKALRIPYNKDTKVQRDYNKAIKDRADLFARTYKGKVKEDYINHLLTHGEFPKALKKKMVTSTAFSTSIAFAKNSGIQIARYTNEPYTTEENEILKRFARVFEQAYIRFMDLQKAEIQAREAQIEAALEKVRSRSLAMQEPSELQEVVTVVAEELKKLGVVLDVGGVVLCTYFTDSKDVIHWTASDDPKHPSVPFFLPYFKDTLFDEAWDSKLRGDTYFAKDFSFEVKNSWFEKAFEISDYGNLPDDYKKQLLNSESHALAFAWAENSAIMVPSLEGNLPSEAEKEILLRFSRVFEQAYIRFMDLEKAEKQAREAQIEAALERVRSRSMAMHKSDELLDLIVVVSEQLRQLDLKFDTVSFGKNDTKGAFTFWLSSRGQPQPLLMEVPPIDHPVINSVYKAKKSGLSFISDIFSAAENKEWSKHIIKYSQLKQYPETAKEYILKAPGFARSSFFLKNIDLYVGNYKAIPYSDEENSIFKRFAKAFEQAYTRFLDLQKAENQAREAEIEAALERVRSKTMAMHNSQDVGETVVTLFDEVKNLKLEDSIRCGIGILEGNEKMETWSVNATPDGKVDMKLGMLDMTIHPMLVGVKNSWKNGTKGFTYVLKDGDVRNYYHKLNEEPEYSFNVALDTLPDKVYHRSFVFSAGVLFAFTENPISEEGSKILERFAGVFGQTYRRYLDLLKAEQQAREAQIEASLERIRARAMAMHHTDELTDVLGVLFDQFDFLGINPVLTHLTLFDEENETFTLRITTGGKKRVIAEQLIDVNAVESWKTSFANWKKSELHAIDFIDYPPEALPEVWEVLDEVMGALPEENKIYPEDFPNGLYTTQGHCKYGYIGFNHKRRATEEEKEIVIRFAKEFGRLYQRFLDIQKAELQARDALKQATLDRVRGQIASMRSTDDLERITPLIWNELTSLEIPFIRCGVFIIDDSNKTVQAFLSAPDGHSLGVMRIPFKADKVTAETVTHWRKREVYRTHWDRAQFLEFMKLMKDLGQVSNEKEYQGAEQPPESLHLHFVPFTQGMLYVGNVAPLKDEQIELVQTLADAFAIAYARYEDFAKLEKAKEQVEKTLEELRATQNQLVQSEKMASLGELTAGIAHEIQNPLNFVNNFSEVSVELLEEMQEEMDKGDLEEVKALLEDIKQNLDKIAHHGKRADGIVKGMLQHSRTSSGEKEPTDINVLADEYLRLAYHGLRAKDKSFNATLETNFDESIGKVNVLAQDLGRVILNLITNAFYVVKEKSSEDLAKEGDNYQPTVTVSTKKTKAGVEIRVKDNGNGIPEEIKEKIFEPFFTTKPTGQGTGLGLSMSYDIVTKGHGGNLEVETEKGKGSTFCITLPISN